MCRGVYRDITGQKFGKLTVLDGMAKKKNYVICQCECGAIKEVLKPSLLSGATRSCGGKGCRVRRENSINRVKSVPQQHFSGIHNYKSFENEERVLDINKVYRKMYEISKKPSVSKRNSSGYIGVTWHKKSHRWRAIIGFKGEKIYLGSFKIFEDAVKARKEAEELLFAPAVVSKRMLKNAI